ncbi:TetR/AcrR family transcriptional regulator [Candidatus Solincola tengchongensis]|uniref:TetR/AcrR family transcriptional regulator n=1 Tax=Candidatus Solincola tengchongensis TaxID=2900693 RepID=UPI002580E42A|nr:TetR/AcrR family transcriptional regulator [Candidatus Solincola tengchongensis]
MREDSKRGNARSVRFVQERSAETRKRILDAAREVFAEKGYEKTTAADIISRAGIGHGTFWLYFRNKEDLLRHMLREMVGELESFDWYRENHLEEIAVENLQDVERIIRGVMEVFRRYSHIHPLVIRASVESEEFRRDLDELNLPFARILEAKLREHLGRGLCRDLDPEVVSRIILAMMEFATVQWVNGSLDCDLEKLVHNLSVIIFHTLRQESSG